VGIFSKFSKRQERGNAAMDDKFWGGILQSASVGGQRVNASTAEQIAAVYACKTAICESISMLPCSVYSESDERRKVKLKDHPLYGLLRTAPNPWMDSFEFFECLQTSLLDFGNAFCFITRARSGAIIQLTPLDASRMSVVMTPDNRLRYDYLDANGTRLEYDQKDIFHVKYRSKDGILGRSPIAVAANSIGFSIALQTHGNKVFENGAFLSGFLAAPFKFENDERREQFMNSFKRLLGASNAGKFGLLEQGVDFKPFAQNNRDAQFLEAKQFGVIEIARIYRMPPHMIQVLEKGASFASIEQMSMNYVQHTIQPWATRIERAIKRQLLSGPGEQELFVRFNLAALIRGDLASRTQSVVQQLQYGLKTINEARTLLDDNAVESPIGDEILLSHNLRPASVVLAEASTSPDDKPKDAIEPQKEDTTDESERSMPLLTELWGRVVRREIRLVTDARAKPNFREWLEAWVPKHREFLSETFRATCVAFGIIDPKPVEEFFDGYMQYRVNLITNENLIFADDSQVWANQSFNMLKRGKDGKE